MAAQIGVSDVPFIRKNSGNLTPRSGPIYEPKSGCYDLSVFRFANQKRLRSNNSDAELNFCKKAKTEARERRSFVGIISPKKLEFEDIAVFEKESKDEIDSHLEEFPKVAVLSDPVYLGNFLNEASDQAQALDVRLAKRLVTFQRGKVMIIDEEAEFDAVMDACNKARADDSMVTSYHNAERDYRYKAAFRALRHYSLIAGERIMIKDFKYDFPDTEVRPALASMLGLHKDSFLLFKPCELVAEVVANWCDVGHQIISMLEFINRRCSLLLFPDMEAKNPVQITPGEFWFEERLVINETEGLISRFKRRTGIIPTSFGELRAAIRDQSQMEGIIFEENAPRLLPLGRALPSLIGELFDSDFAIMEEIREDLKGEPSMANRHLVELAYPHLYLQTRDKMTLLEEEAGREMPSISTTPT